MNILESIRGRLIVSCQAGDDSPFRNTDAMATMARTVLLGGAAALRLESLGHVRAMSDLGVPVIGLVKRREAGSEVYITPCAADVRALVEAGAAIVAADATARVRPGGERLDELVAAAHQAGALVMGDVDSPESAAHAECAGVDLIGTTLSGYTAGPVPADPDLSLAEQLARTCRVPVIAEGRYSTPGQVAAAFRAGAWSVVVGTAISDPLRLTRRFAGACPAEPAAT